MIADSTEAVKLAEIASRNAQTGTTVPTFVTKEAHKVQAGIIAATMANIDAYNQGQRGLVEEDLRSAIPFLAKVGLFKLFTPGEWKSNTNAGRSFVGILAQEYFDSLEK